MIDEFRKRLREGDVENFVAARSSNLFYLLNIYNLSGILVSKPDETFLITSKFYKYTAEKLDLETKIYSSGEEKEEILESLDFDGEVLSDSPEALNDYVDSDKSDIIKEMRETKTDWEVKKIRKASQVSSRAMKSLENNLSPDKTEWELAASADNLIRKSGCYNAFETIAHARALEPHRSPENRKVKNELVVVDLGAKYKGYCSDMTRTFCANPNKKQIKLYQDVLDIYNRIFSMIDVGREFSELANHAQELAEEKGYSVEEHFLHRIGHSLGVDIHETPGFDPESDEKIKEGMVFTLEPGLYVPEIGGVRIEDTIHITKEREKEILTKFPKEL